MWHASLQLLNPDTYYDDMEWMYMANERTLWWNTNLKTYYFYGVCMLKENLHVSFSTFAADTQF